MCSVREECNGGKRVGIPKEKLSWKDGLKGVDSDHLAGFLSESYFRFVWGEKASAVGRKEDVRYLRFVRHEDSQKVKALRIPDLHADTRGNVHQVRWRAL